MFTRYPEPGRAKTRLIPFLGAEGAAGLHRQMAEHALAQVTRLRSRRSLSLEVQFTGGTLAQMQSWLGVEPMYTLQAEGDLGDRISLAFQAAFNRGATAVVIIGSDCPQLNAEILEQAFETLHHHDLTLGPATDGGYYLIGLQRFLPQLFQGIAWSTAAVLPQTMAIAEQAGLAIAHLPTLSDVDYPADVELWQRVKP
jgi:rSAM/selenodomain-associated transferase 1